MNFFFNRRANILHTGFWEGLAQKGQSQRGWEEKKKGMRRQEIEKKLRQRFKKKAGSVVVLLPMQETQVRSLIRDDPSCCGATKPACHSH